jgi:hypothetical protein
MGTLVGKLFVNTNGGQLVEVDLATLAQTIVDSGGSRGDFVVAAPDGSPLLTQSDRGLRLSAPPGGSFGPHEPPVSPAVAVPEPASMVTFGLCIFGFLAWRRWQRAV